MANEFNIDEKLEQIVTEALDARIQAAIVAGLGGAETLVSEIVSEALNQKITDPQDRYASSRDKRPWIAWVVRRLIRENVQDAIAQWSQDHVDEIRAEIEQQLSTKKVQREMARSMIAATAGLTKFHFKVVVSEAKGEKEF